MDSPSHIQISPHVRSLLHQALVSQQSLNDSLFRLASEVSLLNTTLSLSFPTNTNTVIPPPPFSISNNIPYTSPYHPPIHYPAPPQTFPLSTVSSFLSSDAHPYPSNNAYLNVPITQEVSDLAITSSHTDSNVLAIEPEVSDDIIADSTSEAAIVTLAVAVSPNFSSPALTPTPPDLGPNTTSPCPSLLTPQPVLNHKVLRINTREEKQQSNPLFPSTRDPINGFAHPLKSLPEHRNPLDSKFLLLQGSSVSSRKLTYASKRRRWKTPPWRRRKQRRRSTTSLSQAFGDLVMFCQRKKPLRVPCVRYPHLRRCPIPPRWHLPPTPLPTLLLVSFPSPILTLNTLRVAYEMGEPLRGTHYPSLNTIIGLKRRKKLLSASFLFPFIYFMFEDTIMNFVVGPLIQALKLDECFHFFGFTTSTLHFIGIFSKNFRVLLLEENKILENEGEWIQELAMNNTILQTMNLYSTAVIDDLELLAKNYLNLVFVKITICEVSYKASLFCCVNPLVFKITAKLFLLFTQELGISYAAPLLLQVLFCKILIFKLGQRYLRIKFSIWVSYWLVLICFGIKKYLTCENKIMQGIYPFKVVSVIDNGNLACLLGFYIDSICTALIVYEYPANRILEEHTCAKFLIICSHLAQQENMIKWHYALEVDASEFTRIQPRDDFGFIQIFGQIIELEFPKILADVMTWTNRAAGCAIFPPRVLYKLRFGRGQQWDPGGYLDSSTLIRSSQFKWWDPGENFSTTLASSLQFKKWDPGKFVNALFSSTLRTRLL